MELTRIRLTDIIDDRFCILDEGKRFRNRDYRSLPPPPHLQSGKTGIVNSQTIRPSRKGDHFPRMNVLEVRTRSVIDRLAFRYGREAISRPASSLIEISFEHLSFGWSDVREGARFLVFDSAKTRFTPSSLRGILGAASASPARKISCSRDFSSHKTCRLIRAGVELLYPKRVCKEIP
jgi:hypothetical protein